MTTTNSPDSPEMPDASRGPSARRMSERAVHPDTGAMPLVGAVVGAVIGAVLWAAITRFTGYEVGFVAWGIGALVGGAAARLGGRGAGPAMACAGLAVVSIFAGKYMSATYAIDEARDEIRAGVLGQDVYEEFIEDSSLVGHLETDTDVKGFMIERRFTNADAVPDVSDEELASFKDDQLLELRAALAAPPTYDTWRADRGEWAETLVSLMTMSPVEVVKEELSPIDIVFVGLGLITAFKLVAGKS